VNGREFLSIRSLHFVRSRDHRLIRDTVLIALLYATKISIKPCKIIAAMNPPNCCISNQNSYQTSHKYTSTVIQSQMIPQRHPLLQIFPLTPRKVISLFPPRKHSHHNTLLTPLSQIRNRRTSSSSTLSNRSPSTDTCPWTPRSSTNRSRSRRRSQT